MNQSEEGEPTSFEIGPYFPPKRLGSKLVGLEWVADHVTVAEAPAVPVPRSHVLVTDVATDFRVERFNPLGEACRLIVALTVTFRCTGVSRLFRRYYVYEAEDFTPTRLSLTLLDMAHDIEVAAKEIESGAPCSFERPLSEALETV